MDAGDKNDASLDVESDLSSPFLVIEGRGRSGGGTGGGTNGRSNSESQLGFRLCFFKAFRPGELGARNKTNGFSDESWK